MTEPNFKALGKTIREPERRLDIFPTPPNVKKVVMDSDEVTSLCPVTGQPDWETVVIEFAPDQYCIESKSLKLYLWSYRNEGIFCEALAGSIAHDVYQACHPHWCTVTVTQKPRGGIKITATASIGNEGG
jgi:7-cyano-7-deazaguanine reductase